VRFAAQDIAGLRLELEREFDRLNAPLQPTPLYRCTTAKLPDPARFVGCVAFDETLGVLVTSDGSAWV
jgi:hypothetical protein